MARDTRSLTISRYHEIEDCDSISEEVAIAVRRAVCANALGGTLREQVADAIGLMRMLGVFPGEEPESYLTTALPRVFDTEKA